MKPEHIVIHRLYTKDNVTINADCATEVVTKNYG